MHRPLPDRRKGKTGRRPPATESPACALRSGIQPESQSTEIEQLKRPEEGRMQKRTVVALLVIACAMTLANTPMFAQTAPSSPPNSVTDQDIEMLRADLRAQRKEITAQNMNLTADEATKFWPIFDQYRQEAIKINDDRWALIKDYAANYNTMTDEQAQSYIKRSNAIDEQLMALRMKYVPLFEKVISPRKTALWFQIDRRIDLLINLQLSSSIPMVSTTK
jgi:Spy/CpxP family protein refolding chaperone